MTAKTRRAKILIVEDDDDSRYALRVRLRASGHEPITASNAHYALRLARTEGPDIVILDLGLPDVDGLAFLRELRNEPALVEAPVVVVSARGAAAELPAHEAGAFAFLPKPVENRTLQDTIARALIFLRAGALERGVLPPSERPGPAQAGC